jgi:protocatechuate 3,4-dioxygenase beta subunit
MLAGVRTSATLAVSPAARYTLTMSPRSRIAALFSGAALLLATASTWAGDNKSIQGTLVGEDGKSVRGAEIRAQRVDGKAKVAVTKTDSAGHYVFEALPAGAYAITAYVDGFPKSRATVRTRTKGWAKVDFDLRLNESDSTEVDRMQRDIRTSSGTISH